MSTAKWTITFNADSGHDSQASGCGPATAVYGTAASYTTSPDVFSLDGSPDLSAVTTDHILWVATSTGRRFFTISSVDNTAKTVTVNETPAGTTSGLTWAIGGKRIDPWNSANYAELGPDAGDGWTIELEGGTTTPYNAANTLSLSRTPTDQKNLLLITSASRSSKAVVHFTPNSNGKTAILCTRNGVGMRWLRWEIQGATTGSCQVFSGMSGGDGYCIVENECIGDSGTANSLLFARLFGNGLAQPLFVGNYVEGPNVTPVAGQDTGNPASGWICAYNHFKGCRGIQIQRTTGFAIIGNVFDDIYSGYAIQLEGSTNGVVMNNTIHAPAGGGIYLDHTDLVNVLIANNIVNNSVAGYGIGASGAFADNTCLLMLGNNLYNNFSGGIQYQAANWDITGDLNISVDPVYADSASGDFSVSTAMKAVGWPPTGEGIAMQGLTVTYNDIGAAQRQEPTGGGGLLTHPGMSGGMRG